MLIKRAASAVLIMAIAATFSAAANAQGFMMGRGPGGLGSTASNPMGLLQRIEVQTHLHLDLRQKNALAELQNGMQADMRSRMQQVFQGNNPANMRNMTPEQRNTQMQEMQGKVQAAMETFQGELTDKVKKILKPEQVTRLHQLDLQKRGPLGLSDAKVADELKLSPESRAAIAKISADYQATVGKTMQEAFQSAAQNGNLQRGQGPDLSNRLSPVRKAIDKAKKDAEDKIVAALTTDEKAAWTAAQGDPFKFRPD
jgi:hypothetical protein